jgi:hypothetical protein
MDASRWYDELLSIAKECSEANWNGEGAKSVTSGVERASDFLRALPNEVEIPELCPFPDGAIDFNWDRSVDKTLSVFVEPDGRIGYAALIDGESSHGWAGNISDGIIPELILSLIAKITSKPKEK